MKNKIKDLFDYWFGSFNNWDQIRKNDSYNPMKMLEDYFFCLSSENE